MRVGLIGSMALAPLLATAVSVPTSVSTALQEKPGVSPVGGLRAVSIVTFDLNAVGLKALGDIDTDH